MSDDGVGAGIDDPVTTIGLGTGKGVGPEKGSGFDSGPFGISLKNQA